MKKRLSTIILVIIFLIGVAVILYPTVSDYYNSLQQGKAVATYEHGVSQLSEDTYASLLSSAEKYNTELLGTGMHFVTGAPKSDEYSSELSLDGTELIGYLAIEKLGIQLPIYHGTSDSVLAVGVGHLEGSSLPVGGTGTHCVLSGHRGLPSAKLFSNLDKMEEGDTFTISVLNEVLTYKVDKISIVEPGDISLLQIDPDEDYCTLLTCTPYGINTQRLLVRGTRTANEEKEEDVPVNADANQIDPLIVAPFIIVPVLILLLVVVLLVTKRRRRSRK